MSQGNDGRREYGNNPIAPRPAQQGEERGNNPIPPARPTATPPDPKK